MKHLLHGGEKTTKRCTAVGERWATSSSAMRRRCPPQPPAHGSQGTHAHLQPVLRFQVPRVRPFLHTPGCRVAPSAMCLIRAQAPWRRSLHHGMDSGVLIVHSVFFKSPFFRRRLPPFLAVRAPNFSHFLRHPGVVLPASSSWLGRKIGSNAA